MLNRFTVPESLAKRKHQSTSNNDSNKKKKRGKFVVDLDEAALRKEQKDPKNIESWELWEKEKNKPKDFVRGGRNRYRKFYF